MEKSAIVNELQNRVCNFSFTKSDGTVRTAKGTLHESFLPEVTQTKSNNENVVVYFDLEKDAWRAFSVDQFISFS